MAQSTHLEHVELVSLPNHTFPRQAWSFRQLTSTCPHSFTRNRQLPLLNQRKGENDHRKHFTMMPDPAGLNPGPPDH